MRSRVAMSVISERWSKFFQTLLETLQRLRLDHAAHLGEHPHETAGFGMVELLLSSCAINPRRFSDQTTQRVERMTDQRALFRAGFGLIQGGRDQSIFLVACQSVPPFSVVSFFAVSELGVVI